MDNYVHMVRKEVQHLPREPLMNTEFPNDWLIKFADDFKDEDAKKMCVLNMDTRSVKERTGTHYFLVHHMTVPESKFKGVFYFDPINLPTYQKFEHETLLSIDCNVQDPETVYCGHFCYFVGRILEYDGASDGQKIEFLRRLFVDDDYEHNQEMIGITDSEAV